MIDSFKVGINDKNYPKSDVISEYLFFGGSIGGGILGFFLTLTMVVVVGLQAFNFLLLLLVVVLCVLAAMLFGLIMGFIPAALTGVLVAHYKLCRDKRGLIWTGIIGALITAPYALISWSIITSSFGLTTSTIFSPILSIEAIFISVFGALIGSTSAVITGLFALPKPSPDIIK